jgi:Phosphotransferase enzyme family
MTFLLSTQNVPQYLIEKGIQQNLDITPKYIRSRSCKNFNLSIQFEENHFLVKQECHDAAGNTRGEVANEWRIHQFLETFPELSLLRSLLPEAVHFDSGCSILVSNYFSDCCDLDDFYEETSLYSPVLAQVFAQSLAKLHRATFESELYKDFFLESSGQSIMRTPSIFNGIARIKPDIFGIFCEDGMEFFRLYQRYDSLQQAIAHLRSTWQSCCLIHNDLKLDNVLIQRSWAESVSSADPDAEPQPFQAGYLRFIDWERFLWGDPAFDVATVLASYLKIWLSSLMMSTELDVETALRLAVTPLEMLQPALVTFTQVYLQNFPEIIDRDPCFLRRTMQMTGLCLIQKIHAKLEYREPFGNAGICMLQVAKSLLCQPDQSILAIFGVTLDG